MSISKSVKQKLWAITILGFMGVVAVTPLPTVGQTTISEEQPESDLEDTQKSLVNGILDGDSDTFEDGSYFNSHTFVGKAGETITIEVSSSEFDSYLIVLDPEEKKIVENNDGGEGNQAKVTLTLPASGTYTVIVNSYKQEERGSYQLSWREATEEDIQLAQANQLSQQVWELKEQGKYSEAIPLAERVLRIRQQVLGQEHPDVATSINNLALLYESQGRYTEAEPLYLQALEMRKRLLGQDHPSVATSINNLALLYYRQGRYTEAEPLYLQALEMRKRLLGEEHPHVATSINNLAALYSGQGRYTEAEPLYLQALEMRKRLLGQDHPHVATSINNLAELYRDQGRYTEAEPLYLQALEMTKRLLGQDHPHVATSINNLAELYRDQGRYTEAEPLYLQALEMTKRLLGQDHPHVATSINNLAGLYSDQGRYTEAEPLYLQTLEMRKRLLGQDHPSVATSINNLAGLYSDQGRYTEAEPLYLQTLEMRKRLLGQDHPSVATSINNLAGLYSDQGRYTEAEPLYLQTLEMRKRLLGQDHPSVATSIHNLAGLYSDQGRYTEAEPLYLQTLEMRKRLLGQDHPSVATSIDNLAGLYRSQGRYTEAEPLYLQALEMNKRLLGEDHPHVATSINNLAGLYYRQGRCTEAEPLYLQALEMNKRLLGEDHPHVATSIHNLAGLYERQGRYTEAEPLYLQALEMRKRLLGQDHPFVATSIHNLALLYYRQGRYTEAEPLYLQALEMTKRLLGEDHPSVANSINNLAALYYSQGEISLTLDFLEAGLEIEEINLERNLVAGAEEQKQAYIQTISGTKDAAISLHLNSAPYNERAARLALTTILRRKGRLLDFLTNSQQILSQSLDPQSQSLLDELNLTRTQIANLAYNRPENLPLTEYKNQLTTLTTKEKQLEGQISRRSREFEQTTQPVTLETIQKLIPSQTALVELIQYRPFNTHDGSWGKPRYAAYVLTSQSSPQGIDLGEVEALETDLLKFRLSLQDKNTPTPQLKEIARQVDKKLIAKIRPLLGDIRNILLSPDNDLSIIPFEALVDEQYNYLVEKYSFTYLTSGRDLLRYTLPSPPLSEPVLIGAPDFENPGQVALLPSENKIIATRNLRHLKPSEWGLSPLSGTVEEVKAIGEMLGVEPLLGSQATEEAVKQVKSPRVLHIATHGFFENVPNQEVSALANNSLLWSGLILAGVKVEEKTGQEDGILTALETTLLNLAGTKLVVLSACNTGLGRISAGEGIYGLRRALVIGGSESQVISLWKVEDNATKELMVAYYKRLFQKNEGRSQALRQIQLEMLNSEEYQHPYYWASFIPSGDWTAMD